MTDNGLIKEWECRLPELSDVQPSLSVWLLRTFIPGEHGGVECWDNLFRALAFSFIRLVDQATTAYEEARASLDKHIQAIQGASRLGDLFRHQLQAGTRLETCLLSLHRAVLFLEAVKRQGQVDFAGVGPLAILKKPASRQLSKMRNAIEHFNEDLLEGMIPKDGTVVVACFVDYIKMGDEMIQCSDLAQWLNECNKLARFIALSKVQS